MAKISVADARAFAAVLTAGADAAEAKGESEFDLTEAADSAQNQGLADLSAALDAAKSSAGN